MMAETLMPGPRRNTPLRRPVADRGVVRDDNVDNSGGGTTVGLCGFTDRESANPQTMLKPSLHLLLESMKASHTQNYPE
jgi:hypothetical protein